jgi:thermostable 8-oxoguanine DNA glycosylase
MKISDVKKYIDLYDTESYLFKIIGPKIRERGFLLFSEFYKICMWKSARQKPRYIKNKDIIEKISKDAFAKEDEREKMKVLCDNLDGVSIPTASAILTIAYPEKYAVIDIRCLETLKKEGCDISKYPSPNTWLKYLEIMRTWAKENSITPREMDMALFAMHREYLEDGVDHRNLYK